jgi:hypothetical protein
MMKQNLSRGNLMKADPKFIRPQSFKIGKNYLFSERDFDGERRTILKVTFVNYTPCPAIVIIKHIDERKHRCLREDLFESKFFFKSLTRDAEIKSTFQHYVGIARTTITVFVQNIGIAFISQAG